MSDLINRLRDYANQRKGELADLINEAADALEKMQLSGESTTSDSISRQAADALECKPSCKPMYADVSDLISRQAAINRIESHIRTGDELYPLTDTDKTLNHAFEIAATCVYNLPSAQPVAKDINVPVSDCISRQAAIDMLAAMQGQCTSKAALIQNSKIWQQIKDLPSVQERKGRWIDIDDHVMCSCCGATHYGADKNFCPNCGAHMEGAEDGQTG